MARLASVAVALLLLAQPLMAEPMEDPTVPDRSPIEMAQNFIRAGRVDDAIRVMKSAVEKTPDSPVLRFNLALAYLEGDKRDLAEDELRVVLEKDSKFVEAHTALANLQFAKLGPGLTKAENLKFLNAGIEELKKAVDKKPDMMQGGSPLRYTIAIMYMETARYREATPEAAFEEALKVLADEQKRTPDAVQPLIAIGVTHMRNADFIADGKKFTELDAAKKTKVTELLDKATVQFTEALKKDPSQLQALNHIAGICYTKGSIKDALATFDRHIDKVKTPQERAIIYRWMGQYLVIDKQYAAAQEKLELAIKADPEDLTSELIIAQIMSQNNENDKAIERLNKVVEKNPNFVNAYVQLGVIARSQGQLNDAAGYFQKVLDIAPERALTIATNIVSPENALAQLYTTAAMELSEIKARFGKTDEAIAVIRKLSTILANSPVTDFQIGEIYRRYKNDADTAKKHYEVALSKDPKYVPAIMALADMTASESGLADNPARRIAIMKEALAQYEKALDIAKDDPGIINRISSTKAAIALQSKPKDMELLKKACADAEKAMKLAPERNEFKLQYAQLLNEAGDTDKAIAVIKGLIEKIDKAVEKEKDPKKVNIMDLAQRGDLYRVLNQWKSDPEMKKKALENYQAVIDKDKNFFSAYFNAAQVLQSGKDKKNRDYKGAAEWYEKLYNVAKAAPQTNDSMRALALASSELAWINVEYLENIPEAAKWVKLAEKHALSPSEPHLIDTVGWIRFKEGKFDEAVGQLERAYKSIPSNATIGYHYGSALIQNKNEQKGKEVLKEALKNVGEDTELKAKIESAMKGPQPQ